MDWEGDGVEDQARGSRRSHGTFVDRMLEVLRRVAGAAPGRQPTVTLRNVRPPAKTLSLSAEALVTDGTGTADDPADASAKCSRSMERRWPLSQEPVAIVFGPENGAVSEKLVYEAAREAHAKSYTHLYVIGFAIQPNARSWSRTARRRSACRPPTSRPRRT